MRRLACCAVFFLCASSLAAHGQGSAPSVVPVSTVKVERKPVFQGWDFVGRVEAINKVDIRARVTGYLEDVLFKEGQMVQQGQPLYRIEKSLYEAAEQQAEGSAAQSKAGYDLAALNLDRAEQLLTTSSGTVVARDQARAQVETAKGSMLLDQGKLKTAQTNLGYTEITAPVTGKISKTNVTKGNVVGPESGQLTVIVSQDPMYVTFPVSQRTFLEVREKGGVDVNSLKVKLRYSDGTMYEQEGTINFVDVLVDRSTDTILVRASVPNPTGGLVNDLLMRVLVEGGAPEEKVLVPQAALIADQEGVYVFVVDGDRAAVRRLKVGSEKGTDVVVEQGLSGGEQVIVEGLQGVRPGVPVRATPMISTLTSR
jgi:membrane fusion protein (multidrug efflux system)